MPENLRAGNLSVRTDFAVPTMAGSDSDQQRQSGSDLVAGMVKW
jgi:hypothetical protein